MKLGLALLIVTIVGCDKKNCVQPVTSKATFKNTTGAPQNFSILVYKNGVEERQQISLDALTENKEMVFGTYTYEKQPHYQGKVDFSPKNPSCEQMEYSEDPLQLEDPQAVSFKLCFPRANVAGGEDPIHLVQNNLECPIETTELKRW